MTPAEELAACLPRRRNMHRDKPGAKRGRWQCEVRARRKALGLTLKDVQGGTGIHRTTLNDIERGLSDPRLSTALIICRFFGVDINQLWKRRDAG